MRTIKFRGKSLKTGEWVYGYYATHHYPVDWEKGNYTLAEEANIFNDTDDRKRAYWTPVDPATVGQYTGFCDGDDKEIYEGDIMICEYDRDVEFGVVICLGGSFGLSDGVAYTERFDDFLHALWGSEFGYEVIGNIHDNPELMEKGAKQ